ncbi:MAG: carbohydrate porin [Akkermansiaceae bacterium]|nr:carbohydrate porin [Akkermansiaceae bacterium]
MKLKVMNLMRPLALPTLLLCGIASTSLAGDEEAAQKSSGILPLPDYSGDFLERAYVLGDFGGKRTEWAEKGLTFDISYNQYFQSVVDGGLDTGSEYGGTIDYNVNVDFDRMGLIPGGLLQMRAVSRYGRSVNGISSSLVPVNTDAGHPTTSSFDDDVALWLPVINYTQFFSENFALSFGKYDTSDSSNEFAGGRGRSQWWNQNLNMPVSPALIIPYSVLGASAVVMPNPNLTITGMVATSTDTSNRSGFGDLDDGLFAMLSITGQYQLGDLPGGYTIMPGYGWDGDFSEIDGRFNIDEGQLVPTTKDDTWFASAEFWQYLYVEDRGNPALDPGNGRQDLQGVGVFARVQYTDEDTNPLELSISGGINAKGLISGRDNDAMGIAYSYNRLRKGRFLKSVGIADSSSVLEAFYNIELTPAPHLTLDVQVIESALPDADTAIVLGTSMQIQF